jgi:hypothetical protein
MGTLNVVVLILILWRVGKHGTMKIQVNLNKRKVRIEIKAKERMTKEELEAALIS